MIRKALLGTVALFALSGAAAAADLPTKAPYLNTTQGGWSWAGFYIGVHGGYEWSAFDPGFSGDSSSTLNALGNPGSLGNNASGGFFGGHIGVQGQQGNFVFGARTDFDISALQGTQTDSFGNVTSTAIPWHGDLVGKLGYLINPQVLLYAVGGLAYGEVKDNAAIPNPNSGGFINFQTLCGGATTATTGLVPSTCALSADNVHVGWTAGLGLEYAINPNIIAGIEWDYTNLGHSGVGFVGPQNLFAVPSAAFNVSDTAAWNSVKGTLTFKF